MIALALLLGCPRPEPTPPTEVPTDTAVDPPTDTAPQPVPPNLLVFLIDDVGPERFGLYDLESESIANTPVIDAIAAQGVVFDRAYATPLCSSTRAALLTSRLAFRTGVGTAIWPDDDDELPESEVTIAEALKDAPTPWATAAFGKWHLTGTQLFPDAETHPNRQGFDHFDGVLQNLPSYGLWPRTRNGNTSGAVGYHTRQLTNASIQWIAETPEPWFVYVPFSSAHAPWHDPPNDYVYNPVTNQDPWTVQLNAMIETIDISIGLTLASLPEEVRLNTYVVIMGDNGTPYQVVEPPADPDFAKGTLSEGGVRVPLVIAGPGIEPGRTEALASVMDIWPTLFELTGQPMPDGVVVDGVSLAPVLADPTSTVRDSLYIDAAINEPSPVPEERGQVVVSATHKLIVDRTEISFHTITDSLLESPDLLPGPLTAPDQAAYDALFAEYERMEALTQEAWASP